MSQLERRLHALAGLADDIEDRRPQLEDGMVSAMAVPRSVAAADLELAVLRLRSYDQLVPLLASRRPLGVVGVMLPGNALLSNPIGTIGAAFLAGNEVWARFPSKSGAWAAQLAPLIGRHLGGISFDDAPGPAFLRVVANDHRARAIVIFGSDRWVEGCEPLFRDTATKLLFEGAGNCPLLVLQGADVAHAAVEAVRGAFYNAGQACTSPERAYVDATLYDEFLDLVTDGAASLQVGDPGSPDTTVGPIVSRNLVERISRQVSDACRHGATVVTGGAIETGRLRDGQEAAWVRPTVLTDVTPEMDVVRDETFGPVLCVSPVATAADAVEAASASEYGLVAAVFGGGPEGADQLRDSHGRVIEDEIWLQHDRRVLHGPSGGRKRSGWVWATEGGAFVRRDGPRSNALELSCAEASTSPSAPRQEVDHA